MADDATPPAAGRSSRRIPVPMPILIGLVVAIGAGIYLMRRNASKTAAAAQPATSAQPPVILAGNGGGGIPSGLLYSLFQNLQSSPQAAGTGSTGTGSGGSTGSAPNVVGMTLQQAQQTLQAAGWSVATVEQAGIAGQRFASTLTPQQASQQASQPVVAVQPGTSPNSVTLWTNPS